MRSRFRKLFFFLLFLIFPAFSFSQGEFNNWYFGKYPEGTGVTFNSGTPVPIVNGVFGNIGITVNISDSLGNLLFFSDGKYIYNKNKTIMPNGTGLFAGFFDGGQPVLAVPKPDDDSSYYL